MSLLNTINRKRSFYWKNVIIESFFFESRKNQNQPTLSISHFIEKISSKIFVAINKTSNIFKVVSSFFIEI